MTVSQGTFHPAQIWTNETDNVRSGVDVEVERTEGCGARRKDRRNPNNPNTLALVFIINGEDVWVKTNFHAPLRAARAKALEESGNTGRPPDEWEIRNEAGTLLDPAMTPEDLHLKDSTRLFLTLKVGAGGRR